MATKRYPLMRKAVAAWLIRNSSLTFKQIADFCGFHELEIRSIADDEIAKGIQEINPIINGQLDAEELARCEQDPEAIMSLKESEVSVFNVNDNKAKKKYVPIARRADKPSAIYFLIKYHPELNDAVIRKLIGTTSNMISSIRDRSYWNLSNIRPLDPVALGLCTQSQLNQAIEESGGNVNEGDSDNNSIPDSQSTAE